MQLKAQFTFSSSITPQTDQFNHILCRPTFSHGENAVSSASAQQMKISIQHQYNSGFGVGGKSLFADSQKFCHHFLAVVASLVGKQLT
jgi:hypothetical protein